MISLLNAEYELQGVVEFIAEPDKIYVVCGELNDKAPSAVWVEEQGSKKVVGKVDAKAATSLGFFGK